MSARYPSRWLSAAALLAALGLTSAAAAQSPAPPKTAGAPQTAPVPLLLEEEQVSEHGLRHRAAAVTPAVPVMPMPRATRDPGVPECQTLPEEVMLRCLLFSIHPIVAFLPIEVGTTELPPPSYLDHPPLYCPPSPEAGQTPQTPELLGMPDETEQLDVMPAAEESELKYELLGPWTDSAQLVSLPFLPLAEVKVRVQEAHTGAPMFGIGAELSRTGTITVSAEPPALAEKKAAAAETQVQLNVLVAEVDRKGARALKLDRTADGKPAHWVIEVADEARQKAFVGNLKGLREKGHAKVVAEPRLVTLNGRQATFLSGGERAVSVTDGAGRAAVQFEEFGTKLTCHPVVLADGVVRLDAEPEISELCETAGVTVGGTVVPGRSSQRVHTTADIAPGRTLLISGPKADGNGRLVVLVTPTVIPPPTATDATGQTPEPCASELVNKIVGNLFGWRLNAYPSNPERRTVILMNQSENLRQIEAEMEKFWRVGQPSQLTPERVHGGVDGDGETVHDLLVKCQRELSRGHQAAAEDLAQQALTRDRKQVEADPLVCQFHLLRRVKAGAVLPLGTVPPCECKPQGRGAVAAGADKAIGSDDRMVEALMQEYTAAYREGRYHDAAALAQRALRIDPNNAVATAALNLASIHSRLRPEPLPAPTAARPLPVVVMKISGTEEQARRQAADAMGRFCDHFKQGRYEEAKATALQALSAAPDDASALAALQMACAAMAKQPHPAQPLQCTYVESGLRPLLPPVDPAVVRALQKILIDREKGGAEEAEPPAPRR
jgi:tetratricopeptide (TPR) repeat protein